MSRIPVRPDQRAVVFEPTLLRTKGRAFQKRLEAASRLARRSVTALREELDGFVERTMRHLPALERKWPLRDYPGAFAAMLAASVRTSGASARNLLREFLFPYYQIFHLRAYAAPALLVTPEKCRSAYLPFSDVGPIAASNTDDPIKGFRPAPRFKPPPPSGRRVLIVGVGSGLHFDEEPAEFFPVDHGALLQAVAKEAEGVADAVEMLETLSPHFAQCNLLLMDREKRSARVDKCSFNRFAVRVNTRARPEHVSGMVCQDPAYRAFQKSLRQAYLDSVGQDWNGLEGLFWREADRKETRLAEGLEKLESRPTYEGLRQLFDDHERPGHLCKHGEPVIAGDPAPSCTLQKHFHLLEKGEYRRRQWDVKTNTPACRVREEIYHWEIF